MSETEFELIDHCFKDRGGERNPFTRLSIGDDASIHHPRAGFDLVVSSDTSVEGVHWPNDFPCAKAADRAVCAALSDLAAMGAEAVAVWVNVMARDERSVREMGDGVSQALVRHNTELVGGDTCRSSVNALAVTVAGELPEGSAMRRDRARAGDNLWLCGRLGFHALGLQQWFSHQRNGEFIHYFEQITPLISAGVQLRQMGVRCCIDVSDGLLQDAGHIARASQVGIDIEVMRLPSWLQMCSSVGRERFLDAVLHGGEDYALLLAAPPEINIPETLAVRIGCCREGNSVSLFENGDPCAVEQRGYLHFG